MLAYLKGKIKNKGKGYVIVDVHDIGYKCFVNESMYLELDIGQEAEFYIYEHVREDQFSLFAFYQMDQLEMFEMLLSISGVGPKSALGVLGIAKVDVIKESIARGDSSLLTKVSGIGKRTAERMVLELREKVGTVSVGADSQGPGVMASSDEIDALQALGYSLVQAREALNKLDPGIKDSGGRIKAALKNLSK